MKNLPVSSKPGGGRCIQRWAQPPTAHAHMHIRVLMGRARAVPMGICVAKGRECVRGWEGGLGIFIYLSPCDDLESILSGKTEGHSRC